MGSVYQFKTKLEGRAVAGPDGEYWLSPQRDISTNFPVQVKRALIYADQIRTDPIIKRYYDSVDMAESKLEEVALCMARFITISTDRSYSGTVNEAVAKSGLNDCSQEARYIFFYAVGCVVVSSYYAGVAEAMGGKGFNPFMMMEPSEIFNDNRPIS